MGETTVNLSLADAVAALRYLADEAEPMPRELSRKVADAFSGYRPPDALSWIIHHQDEVRVQLQSLIDGRT